MLSQPELPAAEMYYLVLRLRGDTGHGGELHLADVDCKCTTLL
jgi:hypothetical protein